MGIKDFYKTIEDVCGPQVLQKDIPLETLRGYNVAVDISIFLNKDVKSVGPDGWLGKFITLLCSLKKFGIKPVCIFDGPNPPIEKKREQARRRGEAAKKTNKILEIEHLITKIETEGKIRPATIARIKEMTKLSRSIKAIDYDDIDNIVASLKYYVRILKRQNEPIIPEYAKKCKEIISIMGISYFQAEGEAETLCAELCIAGHVDAVLSEDTDVLAYGTPVFWSKYNSRKETVMVTFHQDILKGLGFTHHQFLDMCILLSCDYNERAKIPSKTKGAKPKGLGAKSVYDVISEYGDIDGARDYIVDIDVLIYERCREIFTPRKKIPVIIPLNRPINKTKLKTFLKENNVYIDPSVILDYSTPIQIDYL